MSCTAATDLARLRLCNLLPNCSVVMEMAQQQPGQQPGQMPGAMPGMGPRDGDPSAPGGKAQGDGAGKGATARRVDRGAGGKGANRVIASEFREAMESYFKNVEAGE